jgi:NAD(P)-dependent dehydrogenase (short-subunit alcohol dehydrogenase family)
VLSPAPRAIRPNLETAAHFENAEAMVAHVSPRTTLFLRILDRRALGRNGGGETLGELHRVMEVNFGGVSDTIHPVLPAMRRRGRGQLALVASLAALRGIPFSLGLAEVEMD